VAPPKSDLFAKDGEEHGNKAGHSVDVAGASMANAGVTGKPGTLKVR